MTRQALWARYKAAHPEGFGLSQFKHYFSKWKAQTSPTMRMEHKAGDKLFVDFAGDKLRIVDEKTGELTEVEVFVAILAPLSSPT